MIEIKMATKENDPRILVIGIGGGGNNAVNRMISSGLTNVSFAIVNTDSAVINNSDAEFKLHIGPKLLKGYGAGADPALGEAAAIESEEEIKKLIEGYDMVIVTCGMGGGTGSGATPVIAKFCKEFDILTIGIVTTPFSFESRPRTLAAESGITKLKENVDTLLVIPNDKLLGIVDKQIGLDEAFLLADSILKYAIEGISNIVFNTGTINIDFNDVKTTLKNKGVGHLGIGTVAEDGNILDAVKQAVNSPLLETTIEGAANILVNTSGRISLLALNEAINYVREEAGPEVNIIWGTVNNDVQEEKTITVTVIATGMKKKESVNKLSSINGNSHKASSVIEDVFPGTRRSVEPIKIEIPPFLSDFAVGVNKK